MSLSPTVIFLENTKYHLKKKGILISNFEKELGIDRGRLSRIENSRHGITLDLACSISKKLGQSIDEMIEKDLGLEEDKHKKEAINKVKERGLMQLEHRV